MLPLSGKTHGAVKDAILAFPYDVTVAVLYAMYVS